MPSKAGQTTEKVTQKLKSGDDQTLRLLRQMVARFTGTRDPDMEQEVFLKVLDTFQRRRDIRHPYALMRKIAHDTIVDSWRARRAAAAIPLNPSPAHDLGQAADIEDLLDRKQTLEILQECIFELGTDIRGPVYLYYIEGYPIATIAHVCEKSPSAVKMALHRGRLQIGAMIRKSVTEQQKKAATPRHRSR